MPLRSLEAESERNATDSLLSLADGGEWGCNGGTSGARTPAAAGPFGPGPSGTTEVAAAAADEARYAADVEDASDAEVEDSVEDAEVTEKAEGGMIYCEAASETASSTSSLPLAYSSIAVYPPQPLAHGGAPQAYSAGAHAAEDGTTPDEDEEFECGGRRWSSSKKHKHNVAERRRTSRLNALFEELAQIVVSRADLYREKQPGNSKADVLTTSVSCIRHCFSTIDQLKGLLNMALAQLNQSHEDAGASPGQPLSQQALAARVTTLATSAGTIAPVSQCLCRATISVGSSVLTAASLSPTYVLRPT
eukprot:jgi/Chrpa1/12402/Chrysochromulina_OHIO_Genome00000012-RA